MSDNNPYDLKEVRLGTEVLYARPIEWDREQADGNGNDKFGNPILPIKFESTCPKCAQLISFGPKDIFFSTKGFESIACTTCSAGAEQAPVAAVVVNKIKADKSPFVDPLADNSFKTNLPDGTPPEFKVSE